MACVCLCQLLFQLADTAGTCIRFHRSTLHALLGIAEFFLQLIDAYFVRFIGLNHGFQLGNTVFEPVDLGHFLIFLRYGTLQAVDFLLCIRQFSGQIFILCQIAGNLGAQIFCPLHCLYIIVRHITGCQQYSLQHIGTAFSYLADPVIHQCCNLGHIFLILFTGHGKPVSGNNDFDSVFHGIPSSSCPLSRLVSSHPVGEFLHTVLL